MKSALRIVTLVKGKNPDAIIALLDVALEMLDEGGYTLPAAIVGNAITALIAQVKDSAAQNPDGIQDL